MKIDNTRGLVSLDISRKTDKAEAKKSTSSEQSQKSDSVDTRVSKALSAALEAIENSDLNAGDVHSNVDEKKVAGLLSSFEVEAKQPKLNKSDLLKVADKVATDMSADPGAASRAFKSIDPARVAELV